MSRFTKRRFKGKKKQSKLDQAFNTSKANKKKLSVSVETNTGPIASTSTVMATIPIIVHIVSATGTGFKQKLTSVQARGEIRQDTSSLLQDNYRVDLVLDREPNKVIPTAALIYGSATPAIASFKDFPLRKRFKLLRSMFGVFNEPVDSGAGVVTFDWYVKLNLITESDTATDFALNTTLKNAIFLVYWTTAVANKPIPKILTRLISVDS